MTQCDDARPALPATPTHASVRRPPIPTPALRDRLLATAEELAAGSAGFHHAVAHVAMGDVARAAGVTRTALYRLWPSREDLWDELVDHLLSTPLPRVLPRPGTVSTAALDATQDVLLGDPLPLLRTGVVGYPRDDERPSILDAQRDETVALLGTAIKAHLGRRRRLVADLTTSDLAVIITMVGNGLPLTARLAGPDSLHLAAEPRGRRRSLLAVMVGALARGLTEPDPTDAGAAPPSDTPAPRPPPAADHPVGGAGGGRRAHYLEVASELALRPRPHGLDHVLGHVTLDGLARAAGVTRRTLTNVWPDRTAFRLDLFTHLLTRERRWLLDAIAAATTRLEAGGDPWTAFCSIGDAVEADIVAGLGTASSLAFAPHLDAAPLAERARSDHDILLDGCSRAIRRLLSAAGRRPRPGLPLRTVAVALTSVVDGSNRLARTRPELLAEGAVLHGERHRLTGCAVGVLLDDLTEPLDTSGPVVDLARLLA